MNMELEDHDLHEPPESERRYHGSNYIPEQGSLKNLDLDAELYNAYAKAKNYLADVQSDESIPPNQLAQLMNTISAILKEIVKMQTELHNAERVKKLEAAMIQAIKLAPLESQQAFLVQYEAILKEQE
jgi:hypothetical protein